MMQTPSAMVAFIALPVVAVSPLQGQQVKQVPQSAISVASTRFEDEDGVRSDATRLRIMEDFPLVQIDGVETDPEAIQKYAPQAEALLAPLGLVRVSETELASFKRMKRPLHPLFLAEPNEIVFKPKDRESFQALVGKLLFLGSRSEGRLTGMQESLFVSIAPSQFEYKGRQATFRAQVIVRGASKLSLGGTPLNVVQQDQYRNSEGVETAVVAALKQPAIAKAIASLEALGDRCAAIMQVGTDEWAKVSASKGYAGKLPDNFLAARGFDGSWAKGMREQWPPALKKGIPLLKNGKQARVHELLVKLEVPFREGIESSKGIRKDSVWPDGYDSEAAWDLLQLATPCTRKVLEEIKKAEALLEVL
jgi:hypothetical protein